MKRVFKFFIGFFIIIVLLALVAGGLIVFFTYDKYNFKYENIEENKLEYAICDDMLTSLDKIYESNYSKNEIRIDVTEDELNNYLISLIQENNDKYLIEEDYIYYKNGIKVNCLSFKITNNILSLVLSLSFNDIYYTTLSFDTDVYVKNNVLYISINGYHLGKNIPIKKEIIESIFNIISIDLQEINFEDDSIIYQFKLEDLVNSSIDNNILNYLFANFEFDLSIDNNVLVLFSDTSKLFDGGVNEFTYDDPSKLFEDAINDYNYSLGYAEVTLNSSHLNYLIKDKLNKNLYDKKVDTLAGEIALKITDLYFDITKNSLFGNFSINNTKSTIAICLKTNNNEGSVVISISKVFLNEIEIFEYDEIFNDFTIDSSSLGIDDTFIINSIDIDSVKGNIILNLSLK